MMSPFELDDIKKTISDFFKKTGLDLEQEIYSLKDGILPVKIRTKEPDLLTGRDGQTLFEIQHLLNVIFRHKSMPEIFHVDLDINGYKEKKIEYLKETAKKAADEVLLKKQEKILEPMPSYERRIIHMELAGRGDIKTESMGEGAERRIKIVPV